MFICTLINPKSAPGLPAEAVGHREASGARGLWQLGPLVLFSAYYGILIIRNVGISSPVDTVILTIFIAAMISLVCATINRFFGTRYILATIALTLVLAACYRLLGTSGYQCLFIASEKALASTLYALVSGLIERFTGFRLISRMAEQVTFVMVPPLLLIFLVLGTIILQLATPTEGGAVGAIGVLIMAACKRRLDRNPARFNWDMVRQATEATAKLSAFAIFILLGARVFSLTFYAVDGRIWVEYLLTALPGGEVGFLVFVMVFVFLLAFFLDFFELAFIVVPLLVPTAERLGIDLIWFGVMLGVNMQTSFMHPPFGFALFFLRSVAPISPFIDKVTGRKIAPVTTGQIYRGAIPFVVIQCLMVALVIMFPQMVTHYKSSNTDLAPTAVQQQFDNLQLPGLGNDPGGGIPGLAPIEPPKIK